MIGPSLILAAVVALFHVSLLVAIRGSAPELPVLVVLGAFLGAWAGDAIGGRVGDLWRVGDFSVVWSSLGAWAGIGVAIVVGPLAMRPRSERVPRPPLDRPRTGDRP